MTMIRYHYYYYLIVATIFVVMIKNQDSVFGFYPMTTIITTTTTRIQPNKIINALLDHHPSSPRGTTLLGSANTDTTFTLDGKSIRQPIQPIGNLLVVKLKDALLATSGGILLPDQSKERPTEGVVLAAGPGKLHPFTGVRIHNPIQTGMSVVFGKYDGTPLNYNGEECQLIRDDNVLLAYRDGVTMRLDNVIPIRDYVLIELEEKSGGGGGGEAGISMSSGIVLSQMVVKDMVPCQGRVAKVGEGRMDSTGKLTKSPVSVGDMVKFKDYAGNDITIDNKSYSVVKMVDILCTYAANQQP